MTNASYSASLLVASNSQLTAWAMMPLCGDYSMILRHVPVKLEDPSVKSVHLPMTSSFWSSFLSNSTSGSISSLESATNSASTYEFFEDPHSYLNSYVMTFIDHLVILSDISRILMKFLIR